MDKIMSLGSFLSLKRKEANMTQDEVALKMKSLSRAAYSQIENGNRKNVSIEELIELSFILNFSLVEALDTVFDIQQEQERIKPIFDFGKFRAVLLYILQKCKDKQNIGKVVLYKLLYFSDFNYYEKYRMFLTGSTYSRLPRGPVPNVADVLELLDSFGDIEIRKEEYHGYEQTKYVAKESPDMTLLLQEEIKVIDDVIDKLGDLNANEISDYSHGDMPWLLTKDFEEIDYNLVFKRNEKYRYVKELQ